LSPWALLFNNISKVFDQFLIWPFNFKGWISLIVHKIEFKNW
jgi:hypothetical protein